MARPRRKSRWDGKLACDGCGTRVELEKIYRWSIADFFGPTQFACPRCLTKIKKVDIGLERIRLEGRPGLLEAVYRAAGLRPSA